jgi:ATP-dependent RNA helicase DDX49/DBP8
MFSATLNPMLISQDVIEKYFGGAKPLYINTNKVTTAETAEELNQKMLLIPINLRECYLLSILKSFKGALTIVFAATYRKCHFLHLLLERLGIPNSIIHSQLSQRKRLENLQSFKAERVKVLIATDVASRGLDIPSVDLVINYDIPSSPTVYVHRVGRTARAGRSGLSISLATQFDVDLIVAIEKLVKKTLDEYTTNEEEISEYIKPVFKATKLVKIVRPIFNRNRK